jgi:2-succinyl-5-enolpyruvyl-6-hydroxy-3-cyclohexene-1-carboxylate synthase
MPIRDVDDFGVGVAGRIHGTRGANGIDGLISAAAGSSALSGRQAVVLVGDIAFLHDLGGLLTARRLGADLTIVVVDNRGGGIFSFLPQADLPGPFDLLATPHGFDLPTIARGLGARVVDVPTREALERFLVPGPGLHLAVVTTDRAENKDLHGELLARVRAALT